MRKKKYIKNSIYSVTNYVLLAILALIVRKTLITFFSVEYAGYEAIFTDIFTILSIADMGMDSIISYRLYEGIANNWSGISQVMETARKLYRSIARAVLVVGIFFIPLFPIVFVKEDYSFQFLLIIYCIQLLNLALSYRTGYKRLLIVADQKEYICARWDSVILIIVNIARIFVLVIAHNYYFYVLLCVVQTLAQNLGINYKCQKSYGQYLIPGIELGEEVKNVKKDMGNFLQHRLSAVVYAATDNLVLTMMFGVSVAGLYSNYYMITKYTYTLVTRVMKPVQASLGNFLYEEADIKKKFFLLERLNCISYIVGIFVCVSLIQMTNPFVRLWLGEACMLNGQFVVLMAINIYIAINQDVIYYFRNSFGKYEYDKKYMIFSAVTNLIMSIGAGKISGVNGVVLGTIVGHLFIWYGRVKFVYRSYFNRHMTSYWLREVAKFILLFVEIELVEYFTKYVPRDGIRGFVLREFVVVAVIGLSSVAIFWGSKLFLRKTS